MYDYKTQRPFVFTEEGVKKLLKIRDRATTMLAYAGAVRYQELSSSIGGGSWDTLACVDYLVEIGELFQIWEGSATQHRVYVSNK